MIDTITRNKSFKQMRNLLYGNNVENSDFMLELKDSSLVDIPENPNVWGSELRKKIITECKNNFWFFVREFIRVPTKSNILYKDSYESCNRFRLRIDTLRLFYGYTNNISIVYRTMDEESIYEAIAILMVYEYLVKDTLYPNYDDTLSEPILNIINNIIELNRYSIFLDTFEHKDVIRNKHTKTSVNKFVFDLINIGNINHTNIIDDSSKIICLDKMYDIDSSIGLNTIFIDSMMSFIKDTIKPYTSLYGLFDMSFPKDNIEGSHLYVEPIYNMNDYNE